MTATDRRLKEAFKTALAMVLAYGIALSWDWMNPHWAGFAVAMISLPTAGQSVEKGAMRMLGTLVASIAALTLIALYPQDRWLFMACVSVYVAICAYMIAGGRYQYFWFVSGFVALLICVGAGPSPHEAFSTAVTRTLETGLGIAVYTLVSVFLWPQSSAAQLEETARQLLDAQKELFTANRAAAGGGDDQVQGPQVAAREAQLLARLAQLLNAAASESYDVRERRRDWLRLHQDAGALLQTLESWRESLPEISHLDLEKPIPNLQSAYGEIERTIDEIEAAWSGTDTGYEPTAVELEIDRSEIGYLSHLERACLAVTVSNIENIAARGKELLQDVRALKGTARPDLREREPAETIAKVPAMDPDRLGGTIKVVATLWIAFLVWIYIDPPGHAGFVQLAGTLALALVMMPQARPSMLFVPFLVGCAFGGVIYVLVMPALSGYSELAAVLFAATFSICFIFSEPRQGLARLVGMVCLLTLTSVQNQQTYSFSHFANTTAMLLLVVLFLTALSYVPNSPRPEKVFLRLLNRYVRCGADLLERLGRGGRQKDYITGALRSECCHSSLRHLPARLGQICQGIDYRGWSTGSRDQLQALVGSLHALNTRLLAVEEAHRDPQLDRVATSLQDEIETWRGSLVTLLRGWADLAPSPKDAHVTERLKLGLARIEAGVGEALDSLEGERPNNDVRLSLYRLLGSYRGLSEAILAHATVRDGIDWSRWHEARF